MVLLRLLLLTLCSVSGLVVLTSVPAVACSCATASTAEHVAGSDAVFLGTLTAVEETEPGDDGVIGSGDPVFYTFTVEETFKGDAGDGVVESVRDGASCGLEGMRIDSTYVVFAGEGEDGGLAANLCGGTARATPRLLEQVETALAPPTQPPVPTATERPEPVPTQVPSGLERAGADGDVPAWAWFGGGVLLALLGGGLALRTGTR